MKALKRIHVHKGKSAAKFRGHQSRTKPANMLSPMRGGWRM